jgi:hypothetical protein
VGGEWTLFGQLHRAVHYVLIVVCSICVRTSAGYRVLDKFEELALSCGHLDGVDFNCDSELGGISVIDNTCWLRFSSCSRLWMHFHPCFCCPRHASCLQKMAQHHLRDTMVAAPKCKACAKSVYPIEKIEYNGQIFHQECFKCLKCK